MPILTLSLLVFFAGCVALQRPRETGPNDQAWARFTQVANDLEVSEWEPGKEGVAFRAFDTLGLTNAWIIGCPVIIAQRDRNHAGRTPPLAVWEINKQILFVAGNVIGDAKHEYVLAAGWFGPIDGIVAVYDDQLRKIAECDMESIWDITLTDLTGDGDCEILCWEDQHHGNGLWLRRLTILKYIEEKGLVVVWRGATYDEAADGVDKYDVWIEHHEGRPARIFTKHTYRECLEPGERDGEPCRVKEHPNEIASYVWRPETMHFEKDTGGFRVGAK